MSLFVFGVILAVVLGILVAIWFEEPIASLLGIIVALCVCLLINEGVIGKEEPKVNEQIITEYVYSENINVDGFYFDNVTNKFYIIEDKETSEITNFNIEHTEKSTFLVKEETHKEWNVFKIHEDSINYILKTKINP